MVDVWIMSRRVIKSLANIYGEVPYENGYIPRNEFAEFASENRPFYAPYKKLSSSRFWVVNLHSLQEQPRAGKYLKHEGLSSKN